MREENAVINVYLACDLCYPLPYMFLYIKKIMYSIKKKNSVAFLETSNTL